MGKRKKIYIKYNAGKVLIKLVIMNIFKEKGYYLSSLNINNFYS